MDYALAHLNVSGISAVEARRNTVIEKVKGLLPLPQFQQEREAH
ncbi:hypothetical protein [Paenibacillus luteus]|nr:hypothetical protein [Paenibacillus luteus]